MSPRIASSTCLPTHCSAKRRLLDADIPFKNADRLSASIIGIRDSGFVIRNSGSGFRDLGFGIQVSGFGIRDSGFRFQDPGFGIRVSGFGIWDLGFGFQVSGFGFRVRTWKGERLVWSSYIAV